MRITDGQYGANDHTMSLVDNLAKRLSKTATLIQKDQIADHTYHLKIQGDDLKDLDYKPGEHVRILVGVDKATSMQHKVRTYSVWQYDQTNGVMDLAVCTHSSGIGSLWARESAIGDSIYLVGPRGRFTVDDSGDFYVFVGDPSALAHLYEINRNLTGHKQVLSLIYADREEDLFPDLDGSRPFQFNVLPKNSGETIIEQLHLLLKKATGKGMLYVGGDSRICVTLNRHFRHSLDWSSRQIKTKPFWAPGKIGLE